MAVALAIDHLPSPIGNIAIVVTLSGRLCAIDFDGFDDRLRTLLARRFGPFELTGRTDPGGCTGKLRAYFEGDLTAVDNIAVDLNGTPFQETVWRALREIPAGETQTYGQLAARIGRPSATRAVGHANSQNPIGIVVPCHRVIGANASLTGYAGGLERKRWLLNHEKGIHSLFG